MRTAIVLRITALAFAVLAFAGLSSPARAASAGPALFNLAKIGASGHSPRLQPVADLPCDWRHPGYGSPLRHCRDEPPCPDYGTGCGPYNGNGYGPYGRDGFGPYSRNGYGRYSRDSYGRNSRDGYGRNSPNSYGRNSRNSYGGDNADGVGSDNADGVGGDNADGIGSDNADGIGGDTADGFDTGDGSMTYDDYSDDQLDRYRNTNKDYSYGDDYRNGHDRSPLRYGYNYRFDYWKRNYDYNYGAGEHSKKARRHGNRFPYGNNARGYNGYHGPRARKNGNSDKRSDNASSLYKPAVFYVVPNNSARLILADSPGRTSRGRELHAGASTFAGIVPIHYRPSSQKRRRDCGLACWIGRLASDEAPASAAYERAGCDYGCERRHFRYFCERRAWRDPSGCWHCPEGCQAFVTACRNWYCQF